MLVYVINTRDPCVVLAAYYAQNLFYTFYKNISKCAYVCSYVVSTVSRRGLSSHTGCNNVLPPHELLNASLNRVRE